MFYPFLTWKYLGYFIPWWLGSPSGQAGPRRGPLASFHNMKYHPLRTIFWENMTNFSSNPEALPSAMSLCVPAKDLIKIWSNLIESLYRSSTWKIQVIFQNVKKKYYQQCSTQKIQIDLFRNWNLLDRGGFG